MVINSSFFATETVSPYKNCARNLARKNCFSSSGVNLASPLLMSLSGFFTHRVP
jgi:hypothetical protein